MRVLGRKLQMYLAVLGLQLDSMILSAFSNLKSYDSMIISLRYFCLCLGGCRGKVPSKEK